MDRRRFLQLAALAGLGTVAVPGELLAQYRFLDPMVEAASEPVDEDA